MKLAPRLCARPGCGITFTPRRSKIKYHDRLCAIWGKAQNQRGRRQVHHRAEFTVETGPSITKPLSDVPMCLCGLRMTPGTDWLGRTILDCPTCGPQRVATIGKRLYDQRARHLHELRQFVSRGKTRVSKDVSPEVGDAWRQDTHKRGPKGLAEFLGEVA